MKYRYFLMDVFTRTRLNGNPLAVVLNADRLTDDQMLRVAAEFNLSETVFLTAPQDERHLAFLRIFTPRRELPFAGHPTVGCAVLLGLRQRTSAIRIEERAGSVTALMEKIDDRSGHATFSLPQLPEKLAWPVPDDDKIASVLGVASEKVGLGGMRPGYYTGGVPFLIVPVADEETLAHIVPERRGWADVFGEKRGSVYAFTTVRQHGDHKYAARMFAPLDGIEEDPATGSAAGALMGLLGEYGGYEDGPHEVRLTQGREIRRPSTIVMQMRFADSKLVHAGIGGDAVVVGEGTLDLSDM